MGHRRFRRARDRKLRLEAGVSPGASVGRDAHSTGRRCEAYARSSRAGASARTCEALAFARKSGVDPGLLLEFLTTTMFTAPVYKTYGELIVQGKHEPAGFALPLGLKDVRLVLQAAEAASVPMPIAGILRDRFVTAMARGNQDKDWSVIGRVAAEDAGLL